MSEHDDAGSTVTLPPLLEPPPPPQPAARSASVAVTPISAASEMRFLTSPPRSLNIIWASTDAGSGAARCSSIGAERTALQVASDGVKRRKAIDWALVG